MASSIDPPSEAAASADACSICLQDLERRGGRPIINPGCGHELHLACFHQLLQANPAAACPVCRKPLGAGVPSQGLPQTFVRNVAPVAPPPLQAPQQMAMPRLFQGPQQIRSFGYGNRARTLDHERDFADTLPSTHDPALDDPVAPAPDAHRPAGTYDYSQIVRLKLDAESDPVTAEATKLTTMVSLTVGPDPNESEDRNAIDLVVVVDKSGSMSGSKITQVKDTLRYILETLSPLDRVSIVLFDFTAKMLCGLKRLTPSGKAELGLLINRIDAGGGTTIAGGLSLALDVVEKRLQKNSSSAILLLSDGQDSPGSGGAVSPYERLKQRAQLASSPVFSYGIGNDHDANCLTTLACQGGTFTFVDNMEMVRSAFAGAIGALKGIAVKDCLLTLKLPAQLGGTFSKVLSGYPVERQDATTVVVKFADAYYEEERNLLVEISLPACRPERQQILECSADYTILDTSAAAAASATPLKVDRVAPANLPQRITKNAEVMRHKLRIEVSEAIQRALLVADDENDLVRARRILAEMETEVRAYRDTIAPSEITLAVPGAEAVGSSSANPPGTSADQELLEFVNAMLADLRRCAESFQSRDSLEQGGRGFIRSTVSSNLMQRTVTSEMRSETSRNYQSKKSKVYSDLSKKG